MSANSTECARCGRDKRIPKLYSAANNMIPGPVPPQLQVIPPLVLLTKYALFSVSLVITFLHLLYNIGPYTS